MVTLSTRSHFREGLRAGSLCKCRRGEEEGGRSVERHAGKWEGGTCTCGSSD